MIIKYVLTTQDSNDTSRKTHWFEVKIPQYCWTSFCIGFNEKGEWTTASATFYELNKATQEEIIAAAKEFYAKVIK